jgi:hypothetical protein
MKVRGNFLAWLGKTGEGERAWAEALERARRAGNAGLAAEILAWRVWALWWGPTPADEGIRQTDEIIERAIGHPQLEAQAMVVRGCLKGFQGQVETGHAEIKAGRALLLEIGLKGVWAGTAQIEADLLLAAGEPGAAAELLAESYDLSSKSSETGYLATLVDFRARAALEAGREDQALGFADEVERIAQPDDFEPHARQVCVRARVLARPGGTRPGGRSDQDRNEDRGRDRLPDGSRGRRALSRRGRAPGRAP